MQVDNNALLIKVDTQEYPVTIGQFREAHRNWLFGENIEEELIRYHGYEVVRETNRPEGDVVEELAPILAEGKYYRRYRARVFNEPEVSQNLENQKQLKLNLIKRVSDTVCRKGTPYDFGADGVQHIQLRQEDIANLTGLSQKAVRNPERTDYVFCSYENIVNDNLSASDITAITDKAFDSFVNCKRVAWGLRNMVDNAVSESDLPSDEQITQAIEASVL